jgi:hypothetical protein
MSNSKGTAAPVVRRSRRKEILCSVVTECDTPVSCVSMPDRDGADMVVHMRATEVRENKTVCAGGSEHAGIISVSHSSWP